MGHSLTQEKKCGYREWKEKTKRWKVGIWGGAFLWLRIGGGAKFFSWGGQLLNEKVWDLFLPTIIEVLKNFGGRITCLRPWRWIRGKIWKNRTWNEKISLKIEVAPINEKIEREWLNIVWSCSKESN